ncbi:ribokinase [Sorangium cellulosum]|uniref:Ribokinase n=1 Tax=Sorangium cellulosum TaxID=56 RepID=A0A4V0NDE9_SORCE|nr:PfkB family carbohydrate kinase [Sorangium cellulosum]AUX22432.1 ribokinase [Sorangium cellulosum]
MTAPRIAVVGHVEHVTLGRIEGIPRPGDILHLREARFLPGGGGGIAFAQVCRSDAEIHLFTAVGDDEAGRAVEERIRAAPGRVHVHAARRAVAHPRVVVVVDAEGHRTIVVTEAPLQPAAADPLPWSILAGCDAAYFTGADPESLRLARAARRLVVTARRSAALRAAAVAPDVLVGSVADPRENAPLDAYDPRPGALVLTDGPRPVRVVRDGGTALVEAPPAPDRIAGDYGAGDSFAGALTFYLACGLPVEEACRRAGPHGAAVLRGIDPLEGQSRLVAP